MTAYDYKTQKTVTGETARLLRISQLKEELEMIQSPTGAAYLRFIGSQLTKADAIASCVDQLNALNA